ncbi:MAG TPA: HAD-IB family phosphatase [Candidatus Cybelea sp.]|nr:HAD-IB family phosphatase [Candidatus Cybelea sp.]
MRGPSVVQEADEVPEVKEQNGRVAAFFDLDGTLVARPPLERRLFRTLRYQKLIPLKNYFLWLKEALRLIPLGINATFETNKMYLRGLQIFDERGEGDLVVSSWHQNGHQAKGQASAPPTKRAQRNRGLPVPPFFAPAIAKLAWHANEGHAIVLLSGTLDTLAREVASALEGELAARAITATIRVMATRLEEKDNRWTGRVLGDPMFGKAKARAAKRLAAEMRLDLGKCYAYGDSFNDRWLMAEVGRPAAVNPSNDLAGIARMRGWPILFWDEKESLTERQ